MIKTHKYKEKLLYLIIEKIPSMIEAHLQDMLQKIENFHIVIGDIEAYRTSLYSVYTTVAGILFKEDEEYAEALQQLEKTGYEVGLYFGEVKEMNREIFLQLTYSIRIYSFDYVCSLINAHLSEPEERSFLTSRFFEILNARFNSCVNGFLFAKDKQIHHLHNQKLSIMGQMAAGMAHEIRNPLCSIKGFQQLMKRMVLNDTTNTNDFLNYIDICINEITKVEDLVSDFLLLARKGDSKKSNWETVNINQIFRKVYDLATCFALEKSVTLHLSLPSTTLFTYGISSYIEQIMLNIIKNSISALNPGGILLINLYPSIDSKEAVLTFVDNGIGIPESHMNKIFEPFFTTKEDGIGLGLSICKRLVEEMQGNILIQSKEKEGTTVEIRLPSVSPADH
jgi:two-component system sporulation sensor kinase A